MAYPIKSEDIKAQILAIRNNPALVQDVYLDGLDKALDGTLEIVDANSPFWYATEMTSVTFASLIQHHDDIIHAKYPVLARTYEDLYPHMSDEDYPSRFAQPSKTFIAIAMSMGAVKQRAIPLKDTETFTSLDDNTYSKLVIPGNSQFTLAERVFSIEYPIEIRVMKHDGIIAVWDVNSESPLHPLTNNIIDTRIQYGTGNSKDSGSSDDLLILLVPVYQFNIRSYKETITKSSGFTKTYQIKDDQFYYVRVYTRALSGQTDWKEAYVTHSDQYYDSNKLTFCAKVVDDGVQIYLPEIYLTNGLGVGQVRIDVYTTYGEWEQSLEAIGNTDVSAVWLDVNTNELSKYSAPLANMQGDLSIIAYTDVTGGRGELSVAELRERVVYDANRTKYPITEYQIETKLSDMGYDTIKVIDNATKRVYLATRELPYQSNKNFNSSVGVCIPTLMASITELTTNSAVLDNGDRITITPKALYRLNNGMLSMLSDSQLNNLNGTTSEAKAGTLNNATYLYSPFHYVYDVANDNFTVRVYDLNNPTIERGNFIHENNEVGLQVSIGGYQLLKSDNGYQLIVTTQSGDEYKELDNADVAMQMLFKPVGERDYVYLNGVYSGRNSDRERVWTFDVDTNVDINEDNNIILNSFSQYGNAPYRFAAPLKNEYTFINMVSRDLYPDTVKSVIDQDIGYYYYDNEMIGVTEQQLIINLGSALNYIWARTRTVLSDTDYAVYDIDVLWTYDTDKYKRDENGKLVFEENAEGIKVPVIEHKKGDVIYVNGEPSIRYPKGTIKRDENGDPIPVNARNVIRHADMVMYDAAYYYSTDQFDTKYIYSTTRDIVDWVSGDITNVNSQLLEKTKLYFHPRQTLGYVNVIANAKEERQIIGGLSFHVSFYVTSVGYRDTSLRQSLAQKASEVINDCLREPTVSLSSIIDSLRDYFTPEVVDVEIDNFGSGHDLKVITMSDLGQRCAIRKKLEVTPDDGLTVKEDITVEYIKHIES